MASRSEDNDRGTASTVGPGVVDDTKGPAAELTARSVVNPSTAPRPSERSGADLAGTPDRFINRELSWLDFNGRVLALALDDTVPLLERVKFVAIFSSNLDEYFQVRVAGLKDQVAAGVTAPSPDGRLPTEQLLLVRERCEALIAAAEQVFLDDVVPALADESVSFVTWADLDNDDRKVLTALFDERVFPVLTPLAVDPGHPFPYISDLSLNLAVVVDDRATGARRFARVKVPSILPRFVELPDGRRFLPLEQLIAAHLDGLFPGMDVETHHAFRVTRNADLTLEEEEADDLLAAVEIEVRRRRFGRAVRLELESTATAEVRELLQRELDLDDDDVYLSRAPLGLGGLWALHALDRPELKDRPWSPVTQPRLMGSDDRPRSFFRELRRGDILVHHPYESFATSVEEFIRQASEDPKVLAIKMTLYRTSGDSSIIESLIRAAERGKQVVALVELKARFDEEANIEWARELERAGVHVVYGLVGLKTHTKITLVVRDEPDGIRRYCHVGTGNYNPKTARLYEDLGLLTCDPDIGADLSVLFNYLTGYGRDVHYRKLLVAPAHLRDGITHLVEQEMAADESPHIFMKMNSLVDSKMIDLLYRASQQGVQVDLVIRGICCLRPGVPGLSENIRVRSVVGRYLEHSRIFWFAHGGPDGDGSFTIGSADLMPRNLDRRIEALTPIGDPDLRRRLTEHMEVLLSDDTLAWEMAADGSWHKLAGPAGVDTHLTLQEHARQQWGRRS